MSRYVILHHIMPPHLPRGTHYDLMFESDGVLRTWALAAEPTPGVPQEAELLADHRLDYLDYEGPISGDRGSVSRWDRGTHRIVRDEENAFCLELDEGRLLGALRLERSRHDPQRWLATFSPR